MNKSNIGAIYALFSAILFGASIPFSKQIVGDFHPVLLAGLLYLGGGIGLCLFWFITQFSKSKNEAPLKRADLPWLFIACLFGGIIAPILLMTGLNRIDAAAASLLLNLEGVFTILIAWLVFKENYDRKILFGVLMILLGGAILSWSGQVQGGPWLGNFLISGSCLCWAIDNNFTRKVSASDPVQVSGIKCLIAGMINISLAAALGFLAFQWSNVLQALLIGFFGYGLSLTFFVKALRHIGTARTSSYFSLAPFIGAILSTLLYHGSLSRSLIASALFMGLGVWIHLTENHEHEHIHEEMDHEHLHVHDEHHQHEHGPDAPPGEPHSHPHHHRRLVHSHPHYPDIHHHHVH